MGDWTRDAARAAPRVASWQEDFAEAGRRNGEALRAFMKHLDAAEPDWRERQRESIMATWMDVDGIDREEAEARFARAFPEAPAAPATAVVTAAGAELGQYRRQLTRPAVPRRTAALASEGKAIIELLCGMVPDGEEEGALWTDAIENAERADAIVGQFGGVVGSSEHEKRGERYLDSYAHVPLEHLEAVLEAFRVAGIQFDYVDTPSGTRRMTSSGLGDGSATGITDLELGDRFTGPTSDELAQWDRQQGPMTTLRVGPDRRDEEYRFRDRDPVEGDPNAQPADEAWPEPVHAPWSDPERYEDRALNMAPATYGGAAAARVTAGLFSGPPAMVESVMSFVERVVVGWAKGKAGTDRRARKPLDERWPDVPAIANPKQVRVTRVPIDLAGWKYEEEVRAGRPAPWRSIRVEVAQGGVQRDGSVEHGKWNDTTRTLRVNALFVPSHMTIEGDLEHHRATVEEEVTHFGQWLLGYTTGGVPGSVGLPVRRRRYEPALEGWEPYELQYREFFPRLQEEIARYRTSGASDPKAFIHDSAWFRALRAGEQGDEVRDGGNGLWERAVREFAKAVSEQTASAPGAARVVAMVELTDLDEGEGADALEGAVYEIRGPGHGVEHDEGDALAPGTEFRVTYADERGQSHQVEFGDGSRGEWPYGVQADDEGTGRVVRVARVTAGVAGELRLEPLGEQGGFAVWLVDGHGIRDQAYDGLPREAVDFTMGGNGYRYTWIPKDEVWIDQNLDTGDRAATIDHEVEEATRMRDQHEGYEEAHEDANVVERADRAAATARTADRETLLGFDASDGDGEFAALTVGELVQVLRSKGMTMNVGPGHWRSDRGIDLFVTDDEGQATDLADALLAHALGGSARWAAPDTVAPDPVPGGGGIGDPAGVVIAVLEGGARTGYRGLDWKPQALSGDREHAPTVGARLDRGVLGPWIETLTEVAPAERAHLLEAVLTPGGLRMLADGIVAAGLAQSATPYDRGSALQLWRVRAAPGPLPERSDRSGEDGARAAGTW